MVPYIGCILSQVSHEIKFYFSEGFVLLWKKGDDFVAVGDRIVNPGDARLQLVKETNGNTLVISLAEEVDAGDYVCQVSTYKPIEIKHSVKIRGKPSILWFWRQISKHALEKLIGAMERKKEIGYRDFKLGVFW